MPTEIIAAIVGAIVTGILGFFAYLYQQRRGNRVIVKLLSQSPQITFSDSVTPYVQRKLEIIYNGKPVKNLVLTQFVIFNQGSNIIKPLKLTIRVKPKADNYTFVDVKVIDSQERTVSRMDSETGAFEIERPHLNPKTKYKEEEIKVSVFSDVLLDFSVSAGGEDWASQLVRQEELVKTRERLISVISLIFAVGSLSFSVSAYTSGGNANIAQVVNIFIITAAGITVMVALITYLLRDRK